MMTQATAEEIRSVKVRVNPQNADLVPGSPQYEANYARDLTTLKIAMAWNILRAVNEGGLELEVDPDSSDADARGAAIMDLADHAAKREMRLRNLLGGYGLVGTSEGVYYRGVDIQWLPDDSLPVGGWEFADQENPSEALAYVRSFAA